MAGPTTWVRRYALFSANIALHLILIVAHAVLVHRKWQDLRLSWYHKVLAEELLAFKFTIIPNLLYKGYTIILSLMTSTLALRRNSVQPQRLTSMHDKSSAWMGEGHAVTILFGQLWSPRPGIWGVLTIALYSLSIVGIQALASTLLSYAWLPAQSYEVNLVQGLESVGIHEMRESYPFLTVLSIPDYVGTSGLLDSVIFDIPSSSDTYINVPAIQFSVDCKAIPSSNSPTAAKVAMDNETEAWMFPFHIDGLETLYFNPAWNYLNIVSAPYANDNNSDFPPTIFVASTINVVDNSGYSSSTAQFNPPLITQSDMGCSYQYCLAPNEMQVMACDISVLNTTMSVNGLTGVPSGTYNSSTSSGLWSNWSLPAKPTDDVLQTIGAFAWVAPFSATTLKVSLENQAEAFYTLSMLEDNVAAFFGLQTGDTDVSVPIVLQDLNDALARSLAAVYWRALFLNPAVVQWVSLTNSTGSKDWTYRVSVNKDMAIVALSLSCALVVLAVFLTLPLPHSVETADVEVVAEHGVLPIIWRIGKSPELAQRLQTEVEQLVKATGCESPSVSDLRKAAAKIRVPLKSELGGDSALRPLLLHEDTASTLTTLDGLEKGDPV